MAQRIDSKEVRDLQALRAQISKAIAAQRDLVRTAATGGSGTLKRKATYRDKQWREAIDLARRVLIDAFVPAATEEPNAPRSDL